MEPCTKEGVIASLQSDVKTIYKRIDEQLSITTAVYELTAEMKIMNNTVEVIRKGQEDMKEDVETLKMKPGKKWEAIVATIVACIVTGLITGLITYAFVRLGLK